MTIYISVNMACSSAADTGTSDMNSGSSDSEADDNQVIKSEASNEVCK